MTLKITVTPQVIIKQLRYSNVTFNIMSSASIGKYLMMATLAFTAWLLLLWKLQLGESSQPSLLIVAHLLPLSC